MSLRNLSFIACLAFVLPLVSCASFKPIDQIEGIVDVDWTLHEGEGSGAPVVALTDLKPGQKYFVSVKYLQKNDKGKETWKNLYNNDNMVLSVSDDTFPATFPTFTVPADPFLIFNPKTISVTVKFPASIGKDVKKLVAVTLTKELPSFAGIAGDNGMNGNESSPAGIDGGNGKDAQNMDVEIAHYNTKGTPWEKMGSLVIVNDIASSSVWIMNANNRIVYINASGGAGGNGGNGADRKLSETSSVNFVQGGIGGNGGAGGRGGFFHVIAPQGSSLGNALQVTVSGGKGGKAGLGGTGEKRQVGNAVIDFLASAAIKGDSGKNGTDGPAGRFYVENKDLSTMFLNIKSPLFDRSRLEP